MRPRHGAPFINLSLHRLESSFVKTKGSSLAELRRRELIKVVTQVPPPVWGFECIVAGCNFVGSYGGQLIADHIKEVHLVGFICKCHQQLFARRSNLMRGHSERAVVSCFQH